MITKTIDAYEFVKEFENSQYKDNFTRAGLFALYEHLDLLSDDMNTHFELDVTAIACDYAEFADLEDFNEYYNSKNPFDYLDEVRENTEVIEYAGGFIVNTNF